MRRSSVSALVLVAAGLATRAAVRHLARRRRAAASVAVPAPRAATPAPTAAVVDVPAVDAVVLPFPRRAEAAAAQPAAPARCGETGGRTKAGAPCAARAASGGRCHHHRVAA